MRYLKWIGVLSALLLVVACFLPWIHIESKDIIVTGVDAPKTNYGRPGYFNLLMTVFFIVFTLIQRVWAKRANLLVVALNVAWSIRNYFILSTCQAGECPLVQPALYGLLVLSILMLISGLFPDMKLKQD